MDVDRTSSRRSSVSSTIPPSRFSGFVSRIVHVLPSWWPLLRPLSCDPFTDVGWTIPEFRSEGLALSKQLHGFSVDKKNVLEIDGQSIRFLFHCASQRLNMFPGNPAAYEQPHALVLSNDSVDPAAHCGSSVYFLYRV